MLRWQGIRDSLNPTLIYFRKRYTVRFGGIGIGYSRQFLRLASARRFFDKKHDYWFRELTDNWTTKNRLKDPIVILHSIDMSRGLPVIDEKTGEFIGFEEYIKEGRQSRIDQ